MSEGPGFTDEEGRTLDWTPTQRRCGGGSLGRIGKHGEQILSEQPKGSEEEVPE